MKLELIEQLALDMKTLHEQTALTRKRKRALTKQKKTVAAKIASLKSKELIQLERQEYALTRELDQVASCLEYGLLAERVNVESRILHYSTIMLAIYKLSEKGKPLIKEIEVYYKYLEVCKSIGLGPLSQRKLSNLLPDLDMFGVINVDPLTKTRRHRDRTVSLVHRFARKTAAAFEQIMRSR